MKNLGELIIVKNQLSDGYNSDRENNNILLLFAHVSSESSDFVLFVIPIDAGNDYGDTRIWEKIINPSKIHIENF